MNQKENMNKRTSQSAEPRWNISKNMKKSKTELLLEENCSDVTIRIVTVETGAQTETGCREVRRARNWQTEFVNHDIRPHTHIPLQQVHRHEAFFHFSLSLHSLYLSYCITTSKLANNFYDLVPLHTGFANSFFITPPSKCTAYDFKLNIVHDSSRHLIYQPHLIGNTSDHGN